MWTHLWAILGVVGGVVVWWALQHASGGERHPDCGHGTDACGSCGSRSEACKPTGDARPH